MSPPTGEIHLVTWCGQNNLKLNALKTVEMVVDFRKNPAPPAPSPCVTPQLSLWSSSLPDELNLFNARFDRENSEPTTKMANHPEHYVLQLSESELCRNFRRVKTGKAAGPDGVPRHVFKTCVDQLAPVFTDIFNA